MHTSHLRAVKEVSDGSVVLTVPAACLAQLHWQAGAAVELTVTQGRLVVESSTKPRYTVEQLLAEMPEGLPRVDNWDDMAAVGLEKE